MASRASSWLPRDCPRHSASPAPAPTPDPDPDQDPSLDPPYHPTQAFGGTWSGRKARLGRTITESGGLPHLRPAPPPYKPQP